MLNASAEQDTLALQGAGEQSSQQPIVFQHVWPLALAGALGVVILLAVGFAPGMAHEAAHDVRHGMAFPCH